MKIIFRTNFGKNIGMGHLYRSLSLAHAIKHLSHAQILFIINKPTDIIKDFPYILSEKFDNKDIEIIKKQAPDIVIFDSYLATIDYLIQFHDITKLVMFDDNNDIYKKIPAHILINGNLHAKTLKYESLFGDTTFLLGPKYLVMKPEYWGHNLDLNISKDVISITTGGTDFYNLIPAFMRSLKSLKIKKRIIIGPAFEENEIREIELLKDDNYELIYKPISLKKYIETSKIVITAAGSTIYEILALHKFPVIYIIADNQEKIAKTLETYGILNLGWYRDIDWGNLEIVINKLLNIQSINEKLYNLFDGKGALRSAREILSANY